MFDIGMGGFAGAEKCDLVGLYLLSKLKHLKMTVGLFRDDGLAVSSLTSRQNKKLKQEIIKIFKQEGLSITINVNLKVVEFLDVELNLQTGTHKPYTKPNNTILYVDSDSNHPQSIKKNIPLGVQKRLSLLSSTEEIFKSVAPEYQEALDKAGYKHQLKYDAAAKTGASGKRYRAKQVTWFNPPFSQNVKTNVGAEFLKAVNSSFPQDHPLRPLFNRNTLKVSYRTTANMGQVISRHNRQVSRQAKSNVVNGDLNFQGRKRIPKVLR